MEPTTSLLKQLKNAQLKTPDGKVIQFSPGSDYHWEPQSVTVVYKQDSADNSLLLHELGHALLGHTSYARDILLLQMERQAWDKALDLAHAHGISVDESVIESHMDTYRDWLHARSLCPACQNTGYQVATHQFTCPSCKNNWRVNEARTCGLKRYKQI